MKNKKLFLKIVIYVKKNLDWIIYILFMEIYAKNVEIIIIHLEQ